MLQQLSRSAAIVSPASDEALRAAAQATEQGDHAIALALYALLQNSDRSSEATAQHIHLLIDLGRAGEVTDLLNSLPPEAETSLVACAAARAAIASQQTHQAKRLLRQIFPDDPHYAESRWLLGQCYLTDGNTAAAMDQWRLIRDGSSVWAQKAHQALQDQ